MGNLCVAKWNRLQWIKVLKLLIKIFGFILPGHQEIKLLWVSNQGTDDLSVLSEGLGSGDEVLCPRAQLHQQTCGFERYLLSLEWACTALLCQKEATLENDISRRWAKCVCHVHWHECNIIMSWLKYLSAGWVFLLKIRTGNRTC